MRSLSLLAALITISIAPLLAAEPRPPMEFELATGEDIVLRYQVALGEIVLPSPHELTLTASGALEVQVPEPLKRAGKYRMQLPPGEAERLIALATAAIDQGTATSESLAAPSPRQDGQGTRTTDRSQLTLELALGRSRVSPQQNWQPFRETLEWLEKSPSRPSEFADSGDESLQDDIVELQVALSEWFDEAAQPSLRVQP